MSEKITMIGMMFLAVIFSVIAIRVKSKTLELKSSVEKVIFMVISLFSGYCFMGVGRLIFLRTGEFYSYTQDVRLFVIDALMGNIGVILLPKLYMHGSYSKKENHIFVVPICIMITLISALIYQFVRYRNMNSALYHCFIPEGISVIGLIVWIETALVFYLMTKKDCNNNQQCDKKLSITITVAYVMTAYAYPYFETFLSNSEEFSFTFRDIVLYFVIFLAVVFAITMAILNNLLGKTWEIAILVIFSFTLAAYIQTLFLNSRLFLMDGVNREWTLGIKMLNVLIWAGIGIGVFVLRYHCKKNWKGILNFCCVTVIAMQLVGGFSLFITNHGNFETKRESEYFSTSGLYEAAAEENVIVFVLDKYDGKYMQDVLDKEPNFLEPLKGFISFPDTVAQFSRTYPAITYMLTNRTFFDVSTEENYIDWAFESCSFWENLIEKDFHMYFYEEDASYIGGSTKTQADNYVQQGEIIKKEISPKGCIKGIHTINCYRIMPYIIKDYFNYTEDIN